MDITKDLRYKKLQHLLEPEEEIMMNAPLEIPLIAEPSHEDGHQSLKTASQWAHYFNTNTDTGWYKVRVINEAYSPQTGETLDGSGTLVGKRVHS